MASIRQERLERNMFRVWSLNSIGRKSYQGSLKNICLLIYPPRILTNSYSYISQGEHLLGRNIPENNIAISAVWAQKSGLLLGRLCLRLGSEVRKWGQEGRAREALVRRCISLTYIVALTEDIEQKTQLCFCSARKLHFAIRELLHLFQVNKITVSLIFRAVRVIRHILIHLHDIYYILRLRGLKNLLKFHSHGCG